MSADRLIAAPSWSWWTDRGRQRSCDHKLDFDRQSLYQIVNVDGTQMSELSSVFPSVRHFEEATARAFTSTHRFKEATARAFSSTHRFEEATARASKSTHRFEEPARIYTRRFGRRSWHEPWISKYSLEIQARSDKLYMKQFSEMPARGSFQTSALVHSVLLSPYIGNMHVFQVRWCSNCLAFGLSRGGVLYISIE